MNRLPYVRRNYSLFIFIIKWSTLPESGYNKMFKTYEFEATGTSVIKNQGAPGKSLDVRGRVDQKFKMFVASSEDEMLGHMEENGVEAKRKNFRTQLRFNLFTVCRMSEEENAAIGIFINLERFNGKLPTFCFIESVGATIESDLQKIKFFGEGTLRTELIMSLLSNAYERSYNTLARLDAYCQGKEIEGI